MDIRIDPTTGDLDLVGGGRLVVGQEAIAQLIRIRLRTFAGEYFLDSRIGLPWLRWAQRKASGQRQREVETVVRATLLQTPGVLRMGPGGVRARVDGSRTVITAQVITDDGLLSITETV